MVIRFSVPSTSFLFASSRPNLAVGIAEALTEVG
jgi:hypothetical protein